ncbi:hypothetical protein ACI784_09150 [Geodermatophilus sp. SYSU D01186]
MASQQGVHLTGRWKSLEHSREVQQIPPNSLQGARVIDGCADGA